MSNAKYKYRNLKIPTITFMKISQMRSFYLLAIFFILFCSCNKENAPDFIKSTGPDFLENRVISNFDDIELNDNINLVLVQDTSNWIRVEAGKNLIPKIKTTVFDNKLTISNDNRFNWVRSYNRKIIVTLGYKHIKHLTYLGSANVNTQNTLVADSFSFETNNGAGFLNFDVNTKYCAFRIHSGAADLTVTGNTDEVMLYTVGYAPLQAYGLDARIASAHNRNIGKINTSARETLYATIEGGGNIYYKGNPSFINLNKPGNGQLVKAD